MEEINCGEGICPDAKVSYSNEYLAFYECKICKRKWKKVCYVIEIIDDHIE